MQARHYLFPVIAVLIWAINTIVSKLAVGVIDPAAISFFRWLLAGVLLALAFGRPVWRQRAVVQRLQGAAVTGVVFFNLQGLVSHGGSFYRWCEGFICG